MNEYFDFLEKMAKVWEFFAALATTFAGAFIWLWRKYKKRGERLIKLEKDNEGIRQDIAMLVGTMGTLDTNVKLITEQMTGIVEDTHDKFVTKRDFDNTVTKFERTMTEGFAEMRRQIFDLARQKNGVA